MDSQQASLNNHIAILGGLIFGLFIALAYLSFRAAEASPARVECAINDLVYAEAENLPNIIDLTNTFLGGSLDVPCTENFFQITPECSTN